MLTLYAPASSTQPSTEDERTANQEASLLLNDVGNLLYTFDYSSSHSDSCRDWSHVYHKRYIRESSYLCSSFIRSNTPN